MTEVTREQFFAKLAEAEKIGADIMPSISNHTYPYHSEWRNTQTEQLFGKSEDYVDNGVAATRYYLAEGR